MGFNGTMTASLDLSGSNKLFSVESRNQVDEDYFYFIRLCSYNSNTTYIDPNTNFTAFKTSCVDNGKSSFDYGLKKFVSINAQDISLQIKSFNGDIIEQNGHMCIRNLGISYLYQNRFKIIDDDFYYTKGKPFRFYRKPYFYDDKNVQLYLNQN